MSGLTDAEPEWTDLLADYDPVPGLVARGVMSTDHDPDSCEATCCAAPSQPEG